MSRLKVYYNSACPVCNAGITDQQRRMTGCQTEVEWLDVHTDPESLHAIGAQREFVRERLHVVDEQGGLRIGVEAFEVLWRHTPGQQWLAWLLRQPVVGWPAARLYNLFAAGLYAWNRFNGRWRV